MRIRWRGLELPCKVVCERGEAVGAEGGGKRATFARFLVEPFERGFGVTIGNSLRRVLLSSLEGSAVTKIKIRGAQLEFASLPGVMEDVTEIVLNVKSLIVRSHDDKERILRIEKRGPCVVTAADIKGDAQVDVINPELVIANITEDVPFELEMIVENGRGYVPASEQVSMRERNDGAGYILLDAAFSPVVKVMYKVEETRVGQKTNYDRLILEITTDGSLDPEMALVEAAKILRKHLNPFIQYDRLDDPVFSRDKSAGADRIDPELEAKLSTPLDELKLSVRAFNCLTNENIKTVGELVVKNEDDLLELKNFGDTSLNEVKLKLNEIGLRLGMRVRPARPTGGSFN